jgi:tetratricopeptide (TPR) repeat protein
MKRIIIFLVCFLSLTTLCFAQSDDPRQNTQSGMTEIAEEDYDKSEKEMNTMYAQILEEYKEDGNFIKKMKKSQEAWLKYRKAYMNALYPGPSKEYFWSAYPMCWYLEAKKLTQTRINELKGWTDGVEEGDMCSGSRKTYWPKENDEYIIEMQTKNIEDHPKEADGAYYWRAISKLNLGDAAGALKDLNKAIELNPKKAHYYEGRGDVKNNLADYAGALADCDKAIEINPKLEQVYFIRAQAKINLGDKKGADQDLKQAKKLGVKDVFKKYKGRK